jgi:hypothetical protein
MSEKKVLVKPVEGLRVRQPNGQLLPAEGKAVNHSIYWQRRINEGDVVALPVPNIETQDKEE